MKTIKNENGQDFDFTENIPYREESFYKNGPANVERCKLDLTIPQGKQGFSTVIWFHGGGLTGGAKHTPMALTMDAEHPSAVVACGYRLAGTDGAKGATCIDDAACAVAWWYLTEKNAILIRKRAEARRLSIQNNDLPDNSGDDGDKAN